MLPRVQHHFRVVSEPGLALYNQGTKINVPVLSLRLAANKSRYSDVTHKWEDVSALFVDAELWDRNAVALAEVITKGALVYVTGEWVTDEWKARDGSKRSKIKIRANAVYPIGRVPAGRTSSGGSDDDEPPF